MDTGSHQRPQVPPPPAQPSSFGGPSVPPNAAQPPRHGGIEQQRPAFGGGYSPTGEQPAVDGYTTPPGYTSSYDTGSYARGDYGQPVSDQGQQYPAAGYGDSTRQGGWDQSSWSGGSSAQSPLGGAEQQRPAFGGGYSPTGEQPAVDGYTTPPGYTSSYDTGSYARGDYGQPVNPQPPAYNGYTTDALGGYGGGAAQPPAHPRNDGYGAGPSGYDTQNNDWQDFGQGGSQQRRPNTPEDDPNYDPHGYRYGDGTYR
ncbi:hypothetical protein Nans01_34100 [Nocardiopsis ansamitocini]|uniref:Uncharacterized protein n=1 Tax=Nocardiopsis ansamitocini TaxID=1670832 RepID=A0A9W6P8L9_9ACTN|nr:hypothetical protein Nans01_34100 [Nocardiopsis ansamitocini]